jgi:hypothetical protein
MGFLCKIEEDKYLDNPLYRDLALSNIYNVNNETNFCLESFNGPTYYISGATKPITGNTSPCSGTPTNCYAVYNLSEIDDFNLDFVFTGSTDYTGYTGQFCYRLYNRNNFKLGEPSKTLNKQIPNYINCIDFSAITSSTLTQILGITDLPITDTDYMLRSYYNFTPKQCSNNTINGWDTSVQLDNFNIESNLDWYFITVTNPPTPGLVTTSDIVLDDFSLIQETILGQDYNNFFNLENYPINNEINLYLNGIRLTQDIDYSLDTTSFPSATPVVEILNASIEDKDIITIVYLVGSQSFLTNEGVSRNDFFEIDTFFVTGFTTNVTASTVNIVNNNTIKNTQEVFLTNDFDDDSNVIVVVNGVKLTEDIEYYKSSTTKNKIIFNPNFSTINIGDILSFWYFKTTLGDNTDLGTLDKDSVAISWLVDDLPQPDVNNGYFTIQVTETSDINWSSLFFQDEIIYLPGLEGYNVVVNNLTANEDYKFRIIFNKVYKNILNEEIITSSELNGLFNTKNDKINYGY